MTEYKDWRGTVINVGDTVIYGAPVGRSIAMVEATVTGFSEKGRVLLKVKYRAIGGYGDNKIVNVGPDRLTIVTGLPPTDLVPEDEKAIESARKSIKYHEGCLDEIANGKTPRYDSRDPKWDALEWHQKAIRKEIKTLEKLTGQPYTW